MGRAGRRAPAPAARPGAGLGLTRLFVTGLNGYLGRALAALAPGAAGLRDRNEDVRDAALVRARVAAARPDVVIHTAYRQHGDEAWSINVDGAAVVAAAAREHGARLVHLSTDVVFSGRAGRPLREHDAPDPVTPYGAAKAAAEEAVAAAHPDALLVRTSLLYGGDEPSPHERLALAPGDAAFYTDELRCPIAVGDLAAALLELAARADVRGPLHVAGADAVSRLEFARLVAARGGDPAALRGAPRPPDRPGDCRLDCSRARALLRTPLRGVRTVLAAPNVRNAGL